ncbi:hypothetical protein E3T61_12245 [Cryobacterium lactosi]|uniref:GIY-YIG domain-containing protein n=2 Tax=Cryobacterium lactosi TaxID=1259202 RepID=A0A4R9BQ93_9MICO|nr:hypothetical protein E3T61_12245 [Cryobacterium lactosi]
MGQQFDASEIEALKYYVYVYTDPRNDRPFYIGKGYGNRAFAHLTEDSDSAKVARIREIRKEGHEPNIEVLAFGLDETTAFKVEAAAIDLIGFENLTNRVVGHGAKRFGRMGMDEVHGKLSSKPIEVFDDDCVLIRINDSYADSAKQTAMDLYDATRGIWRMSLASAKKAKYALAIYGGVVREVYQIAAWLPAEATMYVDQDRNYSPTDRFEFVGRIAGDEVRNRYRWKSVAHFFKRGAANPIMYVGPHRNPAVAAEATVDVSASPTLAIDDTVIVAARSAYGEYLDAAAYICQPERYFRDSVTHLGFYAAQEIKPEIAEILYVEESVIFSADEAESRLGSAHPDVRKVGELIRDLLSSGGRDAGEAYKVMLLSPSGEERTVHLPAPIRNDKVTATGKPWGWTLGQRYTSLNALRRGPSTTSQLESAGDELS